MLMKAFSKWFKSWTLWKEELTQPKILKAKKSTVSYKTPKAAMIEFGKWTRGKNEQKSVVWSEEKNFNLNFPDGLKTCCYDLHKEVLVFSHRVQGCGKPKCLGQFLFNFFNAFSVESIYNVSELHIHIYYRHILLYNSRIINHIVNKYISWYSYVT